MWDTIEDALKLDPSYNASYFRSAVDTTDGTFERRAKEMLREKLHDGLVHLARHRDANALNLSMEWVILNEPEWHGLFTPEEVELCKQRLDLARALKTR